MKTDSLRELIESTAQQFQQAELYYGHGTEDAAADAYYLVMCKLGLDFDCDESELEKPVSQQNVDKINELIHMRIHKRIPVAYLVKQAWFAGLEFYVDERVLIPRSPIAELIYEQFKPWVNLEQVRHILDIGTGSACIAIACAYVFPEVKVHAVDIDQDALDVARKNIDLHELNDRVTLFKTDLFNELPRQQYDIIISNPPYVSNDEMQTLPDEYRHEPKHALEAKDDGLALVNRILKQAGDYLTDNGILIVEVGNSMQILIDKYPDIPFHWFEFEYGGDGVFLLTKLQLNRI